MRVLPVRLPVRLQQRHGAKVCTITGHHHMEFVLMPGRRRYMQQCRWCGQTSSVSPDRVPMAGPLKRL